MYNSNINLNLYKTFYDVAHYGSLMAASKNLMISQPAISRSIKKLESDLNVTLFYRTLNGMVLTDKGRELLSYVEDACNSLIIGERNLLQSSDINHGSLTIGINSNYSFLISEAIKNFVKDYPNINLTIISKSSKELEELLNSHEVDIIIDANKINDNNIRNILFNNSKYSFVKLKNDKYISDLEELKEYKVILPYRKKSMIGELGLDKDKVSIIDSKDLMYNLLDDKSVIYINNSDILDNMESTNIDLGESFDINIIFNEKYLMNLPRVFISDYLKLNI